MTVLLCWLFFVWQKLLFSIIDRCSAECHTISIVHSKENIWKQWMQLLINSLHFWSHCRWGNRTKNALWKGRTDGNSFQRSSWHFGRINWSWSTKAKFVWESSTAKIVAFTRYLELKIPGHTRSLNRLLNKTKQTPIARAWQDIWCQPSTLMTSTGSAFAKLYLMSLVHSVQHQGKG